MNTLTVTESDLFELNKRGSIYGYCNDTSIDLQPERIQNKIKKDLAILKNSIDNFNKSTIPRVGDFLRLPDGQHVIFCHIHEDSIQTTAGGSLHLSEGGYISFSGGLDSGLKITDIAETSEVKPGLVWFWHEGYSGGDRGVYGSIPFRVYETRPGADLSGIPQIKNLAEQLYRDQAEKITLINGNEQEYTIPLPKITIINPLSDFIIEHLFKRTGLKFVGGSSFGGTQYSVQPLKSEQILKLLLTYNFTQQYYNNSTHNNTLFLKFVSSAEREKFFRV